MKNFVFRSPGRLIFTIIILILCSIQICAQTEPGQNMVQYLFPGFVKSVVKMKAGKDLYLLLNYNTVTETMVFLQNGQFFDMQNAEAVDTVYLNNKKFIPFENVFLEVIVNGAIPFYFQHKGSLVDPGKPSGYGGTSELAASNYISSLSRSTGYYNIKLPSGFNVIQSFVNWVRVKSGMTSFINERQFLKIFPDKAVQIKQFMRKSGIKFYEGDDMVKLGTYCNELMK
jgi:hypothetical protein